MGRRGLLLRGGARLRAIWLACAGRHGDGLAGALRHDAGVLAAQRAQVNLIKQACSGWGQLEARALEVLHSLRLAGVGLVERGGDWVAEGRQPSVGLEECLEAIIGNCVALQGG